MTLFEIGMLLIAAAVVTGCIALFCVACELVERKWKK